MVDHHDVVVTKAAVIRKSNSRRGKWRRLQDKLTVRAVFLLAGVPAFLSLGLVVRTASFGVQDPSLEESIDLFSREKSKTMLYNRTSSEDGDHDNASFSFMRCRGEPCKSMDIAASNEEDVVSGRYKTTIDILSTGSMVSPNNMQLLHAQATTWASHPSVRYFLGVTEKDDADPNCHKTLTRGTMESISRHCVNTKNRRRYWGRRSVMAHISVNYASGTYLREKPPGWMCAQKRPSHGIGKLGRFYRNKGMLPIHTTTKTNTASTPEELPDYLLVVDDDTYVNMDWFMEHFKDFDSDIPRAEAGCLIMMPLHMTNLTFPYGGFGLILSRGAITNLIRPIHCDKDGNNKKTFSTNIDATAQASIKDYDAFTSHACRRVLENVVGERESFVDGMSVSDLMDAHASRDRYSTFPNWTAQYPYCLHSDWANGYYINYYGISNHVSDRHWNRRHDETDFAKNRPEFRMGWHLGRNYKKPTGVCLNDNGGAGCNDTSPICHRMTPDDMKQQP